MSNDDSRYRWQGEFQAHYRRVGSPTDYTLVACPGSGKTRAILKLARRMLDTGEINFILVVSPTRAVKRQWVKAAHAEGIHLNGDWVNRDIFVARDFNGLVVTYQATSTEAALHRAIVGQRRALVIFDEIHHATDPNDWARKVQQAYELAERRIMLSGTPYNAQGRRIAFLRYDKEGFVEPSFCYTYDQAVTDRVCRSIYFPRLGGVQEWCFDDKHFQHDFNDELSEQQRAQRLRNSVSADFSKINETAEMLLTRADAKLTEVRAISAPDAGGLVIAMGRDRDSGLLHAEAIATHMERLLGRGRPPVVVSEDPTSLARIEAFRNSNERWLIAVRMVSEGVDIPRLRVLAYLSTTVTPLHFDQAAGRIARGEGDAWFFIPDDPLLVGNAKQIANLRKRGLERLQETTPCAGDAQVSEGLRPTFEAIGAKPEEAGVVFMAPGDGDVLFEMHRIDRAEYDAAKASLPNWPGGGEAPYEVVCNYVLAQRRAAAPPTSGAAGADTRPDLTAAPLVEQKRHHRDSQNRLVRAYCVRTGAEFAFVNADLNREIGIAKLKDATLEQLQRRMRLVEKLG